VLKYFCDTNTINSELLIKNYKFLFLFYFLFKVNKFIINSELLIKYKLSIYMLLNNYSKINRINRILIIKKII